MLLPENTQLKLVLYTPGMKIVTLSLTSSEIQLDRELNQSRIIARGNNPAKVTGTNDSSRVGIDASSGRRNHVEITDRILEICVIEKIKKLRTKFKVLSFLYMEALDYREIHVGLSRTP